MVIEVDNYIRLVNQNMSLLIETFTIYNYILFLDILLLEDISFLISSVIK